jgi:uncharacterized protein YfiM (DUF2279 family)
LFEGQKALKTTVTTLTATISRVPYGEHTYIVHALSDRFGESPEGSQLSLNLQEQIMKAPANLIYSIANGNDISLKWNAVTYATGYKVYQVVNGENILAKTLTGINATTATFTNIPEGDYVYVVHSYSDRFGESMEGSTAAFTLVWPTMQAPANLTQSITAGNDINLDWDKALYATGYKVYQVINGQKELKTTISSGNTTSVKYTNMPEGDYIFDVHSYSSRFGESPAGGTFSLTMVWPVVQPPVLTRSIYNVNNITLSWQSVTWANEYRVYEITGSGRQQLYNGTAKTYKLNNISEAVHSYEVTAYSTEFGESAPSNRITENIIYPTMQPPQASVQLLSKTSAQVSWDLITYANGYNIYEIIDGEPVAVTKNVNNLFCAIDGLSYNDHEYYVTSYSNSFGESAPSNTVLAKLIIDTEAPLTTADAPVGWTSQSAAVNLSATDNETGVAKTYCSLNGGAFTEGTSFTIDTEGVNSISFYSVDNAGNVEQTKTIEVKIDLTVPVTTSNIPAAWSREDVVITLNASDALSGAAKTYYSINGAGYTDGSTFTVNKEGVNSVSFYSVDTAGNIEAANTIEVKIDKTAPTAAMGLNGEFALGSTLQLTYSADDSVSGIATETMTVYKPGETAGKVYANDVTIVLDKPGVYNVTVTVTDAAGLSATVRRQFTVYIPGTIEVTPKVMQPNTGVFTVRVSLPAGFSTQGFDLDTARLNNVGALTSNKGYYNQAKIGQFNFERSDFTWIPSEVTVEFRGFVDGKLVIGQTTVKVQK